VTAVRVYLPATLPLVGALLTKGEHGPAPVTAFALTPALREWYVEGDAEELEYAATMAAARASLRLLDLDPSAPRRRVVLAADVPDATVTPAPDLERAVVRLATAVPLDAVAAALVDDRSAEHDVRAAAEAILAADLGDENAQFVVDGAEDHDLLWYGAQELSRLA
jgi:uncharacterized UPF0146 family protein